MSDIPEKLRREIMELAETGEIKVKDKRRIHLENYGGKVKADPGPLPGWLEMPKVIPQTDVDRWIQENVVADTEVAVTDYVHKPNTVIPENTARVVLFKDGRIAILTRHVGFFLSVEDIDFISGLSQGQREKE